MIGGAHLFRFFAFQTKKANLSDDIYIYYFENWHSFPSVDVSCHLQTQLQNERVGFENLKLILWAEEEIFICFLSHFPSAVSSPTINRIARS